MRCPFRGDEQRGAKCGGGFFESARSLRGFFITFSSFFLVLFFGAPRPLHVILRGGGLDVRHPEKAPVRAVGGGDLGRGVEHVIERQLHVAFCEGRKATPVA